MQYHYLLSGLLASALSLSTLAEAREFMSISGQKLNVEVVSVSGEIGGWPLRRCGRGV